ncbi:TLDc domain-containing protein [Entamoeba marina]
MNCGLKEIIIPNSVTNLSEQFLFGSTSLTKIKFPDRNEEIFISQLTYSDYCQYKNYGLQSLSIKSNKLISEIVSTKNNIKDKIFHEIMCELVKNIPKASNCLRCKVIFDSKNCIGCREELLKSIRNKRNLYFITIDDDRNVFGGYVHETIEDSDSEINVNDKNSFVFSLFINEIVKISTYPIKDSCSENAFTFYNKEEGDALYEFGEGFVVFTIGDQNSYLEEGYYAYDNENNTIREYGKFAINRIIVIQCGESL